MNPVLLGLTKLHLRLINASFVRTQTLSLPYGDEQEVAVFSGKALFPGQCTLVKTIILHESVLDDERFRNYILVHEVAHARQWWSPILIAICFLAALLCLFSLFAGLLTLMMGLVSGQTGFLLGFTWYVVMAAAALLIFCCSSWAMEMHADFTAIKTLGLPAFLQAKGAQRLCRLTTAASVLNRMTHPTAQVTVWAWHLLNKQD